MGWTRRWVVLCPAEVRWYVEAPPGAAADGGPPPPPPKGRLPLLGAHLTTHLSHGMLQLTAANGDALALKPDSDNTDFAVWGREMRAALARSMLKSVIMTDLDY